MNQPDAMQLTLFDNYGLWHVPFWQQKWFIILFIILCILLIVGACVIYKFKKKVQLTPYERALKNLKHLDELTFSIEASDQFYTQLTDILKTYLSAYDSEDIRSYTDEQMLGYIEHLSLLESQKKGLNQIFSAGQLIKFANQEALEQQMQSDYTFAYQFIKTFERQKTEQKRNAGA